MKAFSVAPSIDSLSCGDSGRLARFLATFSRHVGHMFRLRNTWPSWAGVVLLATGSLSAFQALAPANLDEARALIVNGDLTSASARLEEILRNSPGNAEALNLLGVVQAQLGDYQNAEVNFRKATAAARGSVEILLNLGRLYQENRNRDPEAAHKGIAVYEQILKLDPSHNEAVYQCAFLLGATAFYQRSLTLLSRLTGDAQQRPQILSLRLVDHAGLKNERQVEGDIAQLLAHAELAEGDVVTILPMLFTQHNEARATRLLLGLQQRGLASADPIEQLGLLYEQTGDLQRARGTLEEAFQKRASASLPLLLSLARVAYKQRDFTGALGYLAHARELAPQDARVHFFFGMVCIEMDLQKEAAESLKKAVQLDSENPYFNYVYGVVLIGLQGADEGYPYLKKYCDLKPDDPRGHLVLGEAYFYAEDFGLAQKELASAVNFPQTSATAKLFLARIANREEKYDEAIAKLQEAVRENPRLDDAYAELGRAYRERKDYINAKTNLLKALEINPNNSQANLNLAMVYGLTKDSRAQEQRARVDQLEEIRRDREKKFLATIEVRPY